MPKKGDPKKDAKLAKLLGLSIDELALTPCKAGGNLWVVGVKTTVVG